ncbi:MAG: cysteine desulfurase [Planctomycetes bacterium]|nr:cysteine desulfurase [Planctomycetota bacterium]
MSTLSIEQIKESFPVLQQQVHGKDLVYMDNAATTQKPQVVLDCLNNFYCKDYATVHRGAYLLSEKATSLFEAVRGKVAQFINAQKEKEIIYVKGTTEAINLVANSWGRKNLKEGDEVLISAMEHHANIVPWQMVCEDVGAVLKVIPMDDKGELIMEEFYALLSERTKFVSVVHVSNALGTINPVKEICQAAKSVGAVSLVDGAQSTAHMKVDVQDMGCDFFAFSSHKIYGPSGAGALYGRYELLKAMPPWQGGGDMIYTVSFEKTEYADPPARFEAGTPAITEIIGMGAAIDYLSSLGMDFVAEKEDELLRYGTAALKEIEGLRLIGEASKKAGVLSFVLDKAHPHDIATIVDGEGVSIRAGHHCAQPVMTRFNIPATARASLAIYNTKKDIDALVRALRIVNDIF